MQKGTYHIGTSGWSYPHWAKGRFYPRGMKPGEWLGFYAQHFDTVEVNMSFYRLPRRELLERWRDATPGRFRFAVKTWRRITHERRLANCRDDLRLFLDSIEPIRARLCALLVQLPPSLRLNETLLEEFLDVLREHMGRPRVRVAAEFRHTSWLCPESNAVLDRNAAALCLADLPRYAVTEPNQAKFIYIRRHGAQGRYRGCYPEEVLVRDSDRIRSWIGQGREVYVYFNNDMDGFAVVNAQRLRELIDQRKPLATIL
ncbi:MAG: DUF72 domain-containing protein [Candidatus Hydrogenedentes bacterium]|nr:DUF72 domain-containing protein [Candidatus Hydrogenedentota bacterium]